MTGGPHGGGPTGKGLVAMMERLREEGFWKRACGKVRHLREELRKDSVASNPHKPVDCCNPPVPPAPDRKPGK